MARRIRNDKLDSRSARLKLTQRREPYWCSLSGGLALGYRKGKTGGHWVAKHYSAEHGRRHHAIGPADDVLDAGVIGFNDAQGRAREWLAKLSEAPEAPRGPYTVGMALDDYLRFLRSDGRSDQAVKDATYRIEAFIRPALGAIHVAALKADQLREWRSDLAKAAPRLRTKPKEKQRRREAPDERARKATANRILTTLKAALNHAFDDEKVSSNKAWGRRVKPFENVEVARIRHLQVDEALRLVNACDAQFRPMVEAALHTGARYSELARLTVADFDRDAWTVFIQLSKGGKARHVELSKEGRAFFLRACAGRAGNELIFRKSTGGAWLKSHQARPMAEACERAKIAPAIGFHSLRHTYASLLVKSGAPLHVVAKNLGHISKDGQPDVRMVTRHYAHMDKAYDAAMIRKHAPVFGFKVDPAVVAL